MVFVAIDFDVSQPVYLPIPDSICYRDYIFMLMKTAILKEYMVELSNEIRGAIFEMFFDDLFWNIQYLLLTSEDLEKDKIAIISHLALGSPDDKSKTIPIDSKQGSREVKEKSTVLKAKKAAESIDPIQIIELPEKFSTTNSINKKETKDHIITILKNENANYLPTANHLRGHNEVLGYNIKAKDGDLIGHVDNFILECDTWKLRYLIVDTRNWLAEGKKILLSPAWIEKINWSGNLVAVDLNKDSIIKSPTYDPDKPLDNHFEIQLYKYYGRHHYAS
jgi:hypothetical protein